MPDVLQIPADPLAALDRARASLADLRREVTALEPRRPRWWLPMLLGLALIGLTWFFTGDAPMTKIPAPPAAVLPKFPRPPAGLTPEQFREWGDILDRTGTPPAMTPGRTSLPVAAPPAGQECSTCQNWGTPTPAGKAECRGNGVALFEAVAVEMVPNEAPNLVAAATAWKPWFFPQRFSFEWCANFAPIPPP